MPAEKPDFSKLTDDQLVTSLASSIANERASLVQALWRLGELEARKIHVQAGYPKLFDYCTRKLRLSNGSTHRRTHGARLLRRFPEVADWLIDGRVSLTKLVMAEKLFTDTTVTEILVKLSASSEPQVEKLVVTAFPRPAVHDSIRKAPARPSASPSVSAQQADLEPRPVASPPAAAPRAGTDADLVCPSPAPSATSTFALTSPTPQKRRDVVTPHSGTETFFRFTGSDTLHDQINQATSLLSHKFPLGRLEDILGECLAIALPVLLKRKIGAGGRTKATRPSRPSVTEVASAPVTSVTEVASARVAATAVTSTALTPEVASAPVTSVTEVAPTAVTSVTEVASTAVRSVTEVASAPGPSVTELRWPSDVDPRVPPDLFADSERSRHIPSELAAEIWARDGGRCVYEGPGGVRCGSTHKVEIDHIWPFALGGEATRENLRLLCRDHNSYWAEQFFGGNCWARGKWDQQ